MFAKAETEGYGGMIMPSWLDRPLSVAGRVLVETESGIESRLVHPNRAVACIPNLCIHFNRDLNNGMKYNPQVDLQPIFGAAACGLCWRGKPVSSPKRSWTPTSSSAPGRKPSVWA